MDYEELADLAKKLQLLLQSGTATPEKLRKQYELLSQEYQSIKEEILSQL